MQIVDLGSCGQALPLLQLLLGQQGSLWLDSHLPSAHPGAHSSFILALPTRQYRLTESTDKVTLQAVIHELKNHPAPGIVAGYLGYECLDHDYRLPLQPSIGPDIPQAWIARYDWQIVIDAQSVKLHILPGCPEPLRQYLQTLTKHTFNLSPPNPMPSFRLNSRFQALLTKSAYEQRFNRIQSYLHSGDCYQTNLCQAFKAQYQGDTLAAYMTLREVSPVPFGAYLHIEEGALLSLSPERFIQLQGRRLLTSPIKGTAPVQHDSQADAAIKEALRASSKNRAENLMIVDLLRNDLGRYATPGSVVVDPLFAVESFSQVHHLVSTIQATLAEGLTATDVLLGCFPGGSITGAPKQRAMEIIRELEPVARSAYCGSIFYIDAEDNLDSSIAIRTLVCDRKGDIYAWAGGGIVADSEVDDEYEECLHKIGALMAALEQRHLSD